MTRAERRTERRTEWATRWYSQRNIRNAYDVETREVRSVTKRSRIKPKASGVNGPVRLLATVGGDHKAEKLHAWLTS